MKNKTEQKIHAIQIFKKLKNGISAQRIKDNIDQGDKIQSTKCKI